MYNKSTRTKSFKNLSSNFFENDLKFIFLFRKEQIIFELTSELFVLLPFSFVESFCFNDNKFSILLKNLPFTFKSDNKSTGVQYSFKLRQLVKKNFPSIFILETKRSHFKKIKEIVSNYLNDNFCFKIVSSFHDNICVNFISYSSYFDSYFNKNSVQPKSSNIIMKRKFESEDSKCKKSKELNFSTIFRKILNCDEVLICEPPLDIEIDKFIGDHIKFCCKELIFLDNKLLKKTFFCEKCKCNLFFSFCLKKIVSTNIYHHKKDKCQMISL